MITIQRYTAEFKSQWDELIDDSINGTFLMRRSYMDYHQTIFEDFSFFIYLKGRIIGVFVAGHAYGKEYETLYAHPGLTYGGLVSRIILKYSQVEEIFSALTNEITKIGFRNLSVKLVPASFCKIYSETFKFFLIKKGYSLRRQELSSLLLLQQPYSVGSRRLNNQKKFVKAGGMVRYSNNFQGYWDILNENLKLRHDTIPVHTVEEMLLLQKQNMDNIFLITAEIDGRVVAGVITFVDLPKGFVHTQYISANDEGKATGAIDAIMLALMAEYSTKCSRLSFGISTVQGEINPGLLLQKEEYGSTSDIFEVYENALEVTHLEYE